MQSDKKVRIGVIGAGIMGRSHINDVANLPNTQLAAICDANETLLNNIGSDYDAPLFTDVDTMLNSADLDAIIIATPHYSHTPITISAFQKGIHVLVEKPIAVHVNDANKMIDAYDEMVSTHPSLVFGAVFMQRTYGFWRKIKEMIDGGDLGKLLRTTWIVTDWFRTQAYYDMGGWRATWKGEGGGVLLNQCLHNLDLYQWLVGMPNRVRGFTALGKFHNIEVEDEVTAYFEHDNGMIGHFITSTGESPGTNRLEIVGENGKLVYENGEIVFFRNEFSSAKQIKEAQGGFEKVAYTKENIAFDHHGEPGHKFIIENFADSVLNGTPLTAPAQEGLHSVVLCNAITISSMQGRTVDLPLDGDEYEGLLNQLIAQSTVS